MMVSGWLRRRFPRRRELRRQGTTTIHRGLAQDAAVGREAPVGEGPRAEGDRYRVEAGERIEIVYVVEVLEPRGAHGRGQRDRREGNHEDETPERETSRRVRFRRDDQAAPTH